MMQYNHILISKTFPETAILRIILAISEVVEETLNRQTFKEPKNIYDVTLIDFETRKITEDLVRSIRTAN